MKIEAMLRQYRVPYKTGGTDSHVGRGWIGVHCPWCGKHSDKYHLGINISTDHPFATCWKCGSKRLIDVLVKLTHEPPAVCYQLLDGLERSVSKVEERSLGKFQMPAGVGPMGKAHKRYLKSRGMDPDAIAQLWGVQGIGLASYLSWRLWIPIHYHGEPVSWTTRAIGQAEPRYITATPEQESMSIKSVLYGGDMVRHAAIICEGPIDCWAIGPGAVAVCGLSYTKEQLVEMSNFPVRVVCFDSEPQAQKRARRLARELRLFPGETHVVELESGGDPAEADKTEIEELRRRYL